MSSPDFLTVDAFARPPGGRLRWRRNLKRLIDGDGIAGLRGATVNFANNGTHALCPGSCRAGARWSPLGNRPRRPKPRSPARSVSAIDGPGRFSLDSEIVRVRIDSESESDHWHGWAPRADGAEPLVKDEPMVAIVHGILRRGRLLEFVRNNVHAASRAAHHPGHRGSIDISAAAPVRAHLDQLVEDLRARPGLRLQAGRPCQRHEARAEGEDPSRRRLPAGASAGVHRRARHRPVAVPPAPRSESCRPLTEARPLPCMTNEREGITCHLY